MRFKISLWVGMAMMASLASSAWASPPPPDGMRNGADPNYVPGEQEIKHLAAKQALANQHMASLEGKISRSHRLAVGVWKEPNDWAHRNYCGPGATQVALDARLPAHQVPDIDTIGQEENIDPDWGVYTTAIRDVLNRRLDTDWYVVSGANDAADFWSRVVLNIDAGYALVTGLRTLGLHGWRAGQDSAHIVAVYGFEWNDAPPHYINYIETAPPIAGYTGGYYMRERRGPFFNDFVSRNNSQVW